MNLAKRSRAGAPACLLPFAAGVVVVLTGCGGSVYSLGTIPGDGGDGGDGGGSSSHFCTSSDPCDGGTTGFASNDAGTNSDDAEVVVSRPDAAGSDDAVAAGLCRSAALSCSGGATGYACSAGYPANDQPGLSCTSGVINGFETDYCCFPWPGVGGPCTPDPEFPCDGTSYAYQCTPGTTPPAVDAHLHCGTNFVDSNGNNNFCCTYQ